MKTLSEVANFFENIKEFTTCFYLQVLFIYQDFYRLTRNFIYKKEVIRQIVNFRNVDNFVIQFITGKPTTVSLINS